MGNGGKCKRSMQLSESWGKKPKCVWWNNKIKAVRRECWQLAMKKDVWKCREEKRERLKGVWIESQMHG